MKIPKSRKSADKVFDIISNLPPFPTLDEVINACKEKDAIPYHIINVAKLGHLLPESERYLLKNY